VLPLLAAMFAGYTNGYVAPNPLVASIQEDGTCVDGEGKTQLCCAWQVRRAGGRAGGRAGLPGMLQHARVGRPALGTLQQARRAGA